jgi:hypothetical protein
MKNLGKKKSEGPGKGGGSVKGVGKGVPSAVLLSILIHTGLFLLAGMLVVFTVVKKTELAFEPPKAVKRPKMKLKKPQVRIKKTSRPKSTTRIVTKNRVSMPDIQLPEMSGLGDGLCDGLGDDGFDMMVDLDAISVFGKGQTIGNDFEGMVYSLARGRSGSRMATDEEKFRSTLRKYVLSGWKDAVLSPYYRAPTKRYTTHFMVPSIPTAMAPRAFGVPDLEDFFIFVVYKGQLVHTTDIKFRFWATGDSYLFINVNGKEVLTNGWLGHAGIFDWWTSSAGGSGTYPLGNKFMSVGDWIELKAGEPVVMKVLYGEYLRGAFSAQILVEVDGVDYPTSRYGGPLLPAFKTEEFTWDQLTQIHRYLPSQECSLTNGPIFNDYYTPPQESTVAAQPAPTDGQESKVEPVLPELGKSPFRVWTLREGRTIEAEFNTILADNLILKTVEGKQLIIPLNKVSDADIDYSRLTMPPELHIELSKKSRQSQWGDTWNGEPLSVRGSVYTYTAKIKQTSIRPYGFGLTAELYVIGSEIGGNKQILLDRQTADFTLSKENEMSFNFSGKEVELIDYKVNNERRGQRYDTFLVVITDSRREIIAHRTPSKQLFRNLDRLKKIKVGWYFDKDCNRCLPTPPAPSLVANASF